MNPYAEYAYDGVVLNPLEVLFVKVKAFQQEAKWTSTRMAMAYARWKEVQVTHVSSTQTRFGSTFRIGRLGNYELVLSVIVLS